MEEVGHRSIETPGRRWVGLLVARLAIGHTKREGGVRAKSWTRPVIESPRRGKTQGSFRRYGELTLCPAARDSRIGKPQKPGSVGPVQRFGVGSTDRWNGKWGDPGGNARRPFERRTLRRVNPMSAAGVKENRHGIEGRKPSRGWPNPEGGT